LGTDEENLEYLEYFMAQIGVDSEEVLAQLRSELSEDQIQALAADHSTYYGLAQMAADQLAQTESLSLDDFDEDYDF